MTSSVVLTDLPDAAMLTIALQGCRHGLDLRSVETTAAGQSRVVGVGDLRSSLSTATV